MKSGMNDERVSALPAANPSSQRTGSANSHGARLLGKTMLIISLPLGEMCGFIAGHPIGLRAVQVWAWTPETWLLDC